MRPLLRVTPTRVLREGRACLVDYPVSRRIRGVLIELASTIVPVTLLATLSSAEVELLHAAAVALLAQSAFAFASGLDRAQLRYWKLTASLYRWSRQASAQGDVLELLVDCANAACWALWRLQAIAAGGSLAAGLTLLLAPGLITALTYWPAILAIATCGGTLIAAVRVADRALEDFIRAPSARRCV